MRAVSLCAVVVCAVILAASTVLGLFTRPARSAVKEVTTIPGSKFVSCFNDKGIIYHANTYEKEGLLHQYYEEIRQYNIHSGIPTAFIVAGANLDMAILDTHRVLFSSQAYSPVSVYSRRKEKCWLFVSLGVRFADYFHKVAPLVFDRNKRTLTFTYMRDGDTGRPRQVRGYVYWIPLGKVPDGEYTIRLVPRGSERPTFSQVLSVVNE